MKLRRSLKGLTTVVFAILLIASSSLTAFAGVSLTPTENRYNEGRNNDNRYDVEEKDNKPNDGNQGNKNQIIKLRYDDDYVRWDKIEDATKYELRFYYKNGGYIDTKTTTDNKYKMSKIESLVKSDDHYGNVEFYFKIRPVYSDGKKGNETTSKTLTIWVEKKSNSSSSSVCGGPAYSSNTGYSWTGSTGAWYLWNNGKKATGWHFVNGYWYYMYSDGKMATGWFTEGNYTYYLNPSTSASIPEGAMVTGYWSVNGTQHYFNPNSGGPQGSMVW